MGGYDKLKDSNELAALSRAIASQAAGTSSTVAAPHARTKSVEASQVELERPKDGKLKKTKKKRKLDVAVPQAIHEDKEKKKKKEKKRKKRAAESEPQQQLEGCVVEYDEEGHNANVEEQQLGDTQKDDVRDSCLRIHQLLRCISESMDDATHGDQDGASTKSHVNSLFDLIRGLPQTAQRDALVERCTTLASRVAEAAAGIVSKSGQHFGHAIGTAGGADTIQSLVALPKGNDRNMPLPQQYEQVRLWHAIQQLNTTVMKEVQHMMESHGSREGTGVGTADRADQKTPAFEEVYRDAFAMGFSDDLDAMRGEGGGGGEAVSLELLVQCISAGVDLFSGVERRLIVNALGPAAGTGV